MSGLMLCHTVRRFSSRYVPTILASLCAVSILIAPPVAAQDVSAKADGNTLLGFIVSLNRKGNLITVRKIASRAPEPVHQPSLNGKPALHAPTIARKPMPLAARAMPQPRATKVPLPTAGKPVGSAAVKAPARVPDKVAAKIPGATFGVSPNMMSAAWQAAAVEIVAAGRGRINYEAGVIKAIGLGAIAPPTLRKSRSQDILDAREAAFNDAMRSLGVAISQVRVSADTRVSNYVLKSDDVRVRIEAVVKNAEVVEEKILPNSGVYRVVVQSHMAGPNSLMEAIEPEIAHPVLSPTPAAPKPLATPEPRQIERPNLWAPGAPAPDGVEYTSLIVDCRGLRVNACMSPRVYDTENREVYGTMKISPEYVIETGIAAFPRSMSEARRCSRAGDRPLIVRAVGVADDNRFYPIIRTRDAERARSGNDSSHYFERTAVILLLDPEN